jgi:hypothetical protein
MTVRSSFGTAFREAAEQAESRIRHDGFETSVMEIQKDDLSRSVRMMLVTMLGSVPDSVSCVCVRAQVP